MKGNEVNAVNKTGFTLIEILIVVLIIGLLASIAVPGYRKAVEKSKVADALTTMSAVAKSEHGFYLAKNKYTKDFADLDVSLIDKDGNKAEDSSFETVNYTFTLQKDNIKAERANGEYSLYKFYEEDSVYCLPREHYICQQYNWGVNKQLCKDIENVWHTASSTCYNSQKERCQTEYGNSLWHEDQENHENDFCGYTNTGGKTINEGMKCVNTGHYTCRSIVNSGGECNAGTNVWGGCNGSTINAGGVCLATGLRSCASVTISGGECKDGEGSNGQSCWYSSISAGGKCTAMCDYPKIYKDGECSGACYHAEIYDGGVCSGGCGTAKVYNGGVCSGNCQGATINDGGICKSSAKNNCYDITHPYYPTVYTGTGCCCGDYCGNAPKCDQARCDALD